MSLGAGGSDPVLFLAFLLVACLLGLAQHRFATTPPRDWNEIGWFFRLGRILLILIFLGVIFAPITWLLLR
jgi:hypothetical protein